MSLLNFVKSAGTKLFGGGKSDEAALRDHLRENNLDTDDIDIQLEDGKVTAAGRAASQEAKEKIAVALGNVEGVEVVDMAVETPAAEPESRFYTVQSGDTLSAIAQREYGNGGEYMKIFEANRPMLSDPDKIYPGQVLRIPE